MCLLSINNYSLNFFKTYFSVKCFSKSAAVHTKISNELRSRKYQFFLRLSCTLKYNKRDIEKHTKKHWERRRRNTRKRSRECVRERKQRDTTNKWESREIKHRKTERLQQKEREKTKWESREIKQRKQKDYNREGEREREKKWNKIVKKDKNRVI